MLGVHHGRLAAKRGMVLTSGRRSSRAGSRSAAVVKRAGAVRAMQPQPRGLLQLLEHGHGGRASRARRWARAARASRRGGARLRLRAAAMAIGDRAPRRDRVAGPAVGDERHVADLHHEIGRDGRQDVVGAPHPGQGEGDQMRGMGVDDACAAGPPRRWRGAARASCLPADRSAAGRAMSTLARRCRLEEAEARIGGRDQEASSWGRRTLMLPAVACT